MLINLSNHPLSSWDKLQLKTAMENFGSVIDIVFPTIDPSADTQEVINLAEEFSIECLNLISSSQDSSNAVHVMGELTFTFHLVSLLKGKGIKCVASTTERISEEKGNSKTSIFNFAAFREF